MEKMIKTYNLDVDDFAKGVFAISLVENPAVGYSFLYFDKEVEVQNFAVEDEDEQIVFGVIMLADTPIYRKAIAGTSIGDHYVQFAPETIKEIVKKYAKDKLSDSVTTAHLNKTEDVFLFESYIIDRGMGINPPTAFKDIPDGSWVGKFQVNNKEVWGKIKDGTFKGFSVEGEFKYVQPQCFEDAELQFFEDLYINLIKRK